MIPKTLTIQGLYSYQQKQTIDFSQLMASQLFGIFGTVGSGKSSILEAISFAIYGETERLNNRDKRSYNMMNLKSNEMLIDFECVNHRNEEWRFIVKSKRSGKNFDDITSSPKRILKYVNGDWVAVEDADVVDIIGLSYENFRRTIIIPQGKFQEFLQLGDKDRTKMLREIFNLGKYEFFHQTNGLIDTDKKRLEHLNGQLVQYDDINPDAITLQTKQADELSLQLKVGREELKQKEQEAAVLGASKEKHQRREQLKTKLDELGASKDHYDELDDKIRAYEQCVRLFSESLNTKRRLNKRIEQLQAEEHERSDQLQQLTQQSGQLDKSWGRVSGEYEQRDVFNKKADDLGRILLIKNKEAEIAGITGKLKLRRENEEGLRRATEDLKAKIKRYKTELKTLHSNRPNEQVLAELTAWYSRQDDLNTQLNGYKKSLLSAKTKMNHISESRLKGIRVCNNGLGLSLDESLPLDKVVNVLGSLITLCDEQIEAAQKHHTHTSVHLKLEEFAGQLQDGNACPLCGSEDHPAPLSGESEARLEEIDTELNALKGKRKEAELVSRKFGELAIKTDENNEQISGIQQQQEQLCRALELHSQNFVWEQYDKNSREKLEQDQQKASSAQAVIGETEKNLEQAEATLEQTVEKLEAETKLLQQLQLQLQSLHATLDSELQNLTALSSSDYGLIDLETIETERNSLIKQVADTEKAYKKLQREREELSGKISRLTGGLEETKKSLKTDTSELRETENKIQVCLKSSGFSELGEVEQILAEELDTDTLRKEIGEYRNQLHSAGEQKAVLDAELGESSFDSDAYEQLTQQLSQKREALDNLIGETNSALEKAREMAQKLKEKQKLNKEHKALDNRLGDLYELRKLFMSSGFVNYISSVYLRQLCDAANKRFYVLTRQQLRLELTESNSFQVRDFLNDGRLRNIKTLSGGQTFQASLCLALALAESVQDQHKTQQNFFFLDEGFGSLDRDSLQTVFETLKSLRQESRVVGIISHVEELQQEIDVFLNITNHAENGSLIGRSWE